jgi:hypothetical protein
VSGLAIVCDSLSGKALVEDSLFHWLLERFGELVGAFAVEMDIRDRVSNVNKRSTKSCPPPRVQL